MPRSEKGCLSALRKGWDANIIRYQCGELLVGRPRLCLGPLVVITRGSFCYFMDLRSALPPIRKYKKYLDEGPSVLHFFISDVRACGFRHDWILIGLCLFDSSEFKVRVGEVKCNLTLQWAHLSLSLLPSPISTFRVEKVKKRTKKSLSRSHKISSAAVELWIFYSKPRSGIYSPMQWISRWGRLWSGNHVEMSGNEEMV